VRRRAVLAIGHGHDAAAASSAGAHRPANCRGDPQREPPRRVARVRRLLPQRARRPLQGVPGRRVRTARRLEGRLGCSHAVGQPGQWQLGDQVRGRRLHPAHDRSEPVCDQGLVGGRRERGGCLPASLCWRPHDPAAAVPAALAEPEPGLSRDQRQPPLLHLCRLARAVLCAAASACTAQPPPRGRPPAATREASPPSAARPGLRVGATSLRPRPQAWTASTRTWPSARTTSSGRTASLPRRGRGSGWARAHRSRASTRRRTSASPRPTSTSPARPSPSRCRPCRAATARRGRCCSSTRAGTTTRA